jgi:hypothetical protein
MKRRRGKERGENLIIFMFGSKEEKGWEGRYFNYKCVWFTRGGKRMEDKTKLLFYPYNITRVS